MNNEEQAIYNRCVELSAKYWSFKAAPHIVCGIASNAGSMDEIVVKSPRVQMAAAQAISAFYTTLKNEISEPSFSAKLLAKDLAGWVPKLGGSGLGTTGPLRKSYFATANFGTKVTESWMLYFVPETLCKNKEGTELKTFYDGTRNGLVLGDDFIDHSVLLDPRESEIALQRILNKISLESTYSPEPDDMQKILLPVPTIEN